MAKQIQLRRGTTTENNAFKGALGELTYDTEKKQLRVHDGSTVGGKVVDDTTRDVTSQVSNATETVAGKAKIATTAIAQEGVNDTDIITAKKLRDALNVSGNAPMFACRAWVNFNGTGTVAIRASGNVSSITDNGVGNYNINFITPMSDTNYALSGFAIWINGQAAGSVSQTSEYAPSVNYVPIRTVNSNNGADFYDAAVVTVTVFR